VNVNCAAARRDIPRWVAVACTIGYGACATWPVASAAEEDRAPCTRFEVMSENFLGCVRALIEISEKEKPIGQVVLAEPIHGYLVNLADTQGYHGAMSDLDELKRRSTTLKLDPVINRASIVALDNAIASHVDEIRPAVSTKTLAAHAKPGTNIYRPFVEQKLAFLDSNKIRFYDRGPFEATVRALLANALESTYFLEGGVGKANDAILRREMQILDELLTRVKDPQYSYLALPVDHQKSRINSNRFWRASILFALGDKPALRDMLRDLVLNNIQFGLETASPGHIFIYKVFDLPTEITVVRGVDDSPQVEIKESDVVSRFFNPAQLALLACAHLETAGSDQIPAFVTAIKDLVYYDYYVVAASAHNSTQLEQFDSAIHHALESGKLREQRANLLKNVADQGEDFSDTVKRGARLCDINESVRDEIYSPFDFKSQIKHIEGLGTHSELLLFGGRLNAGQARAVADFLNVSVFPKVRAQQEKFDVDSTALVARMRIGQ
jgi:hypothetical protein